MLKLMLPGLLALSFVLVPQPADARSHHSSSAGPQCRKGCPCGNSCISCDKVCHVGEGAAWKDQGPQTDDGSSTTAPKPANVSQDAWVAVPEKVTTTFDGCVRRDVNTGKVVPAKGPREDFELDNPCPANGSNRGGCPGWIIGYKNPLEQGGCDVASNLRWVKPGDQPTPGPAPAAVTEGTTCTVQRDSTRRIIRSKSARDAFMRAHPCPATHKTTGACPGYIVDHVKALKHGGCDDPANMQWQTTADAKEKDKWE